MPSTFLVKLDKLPGINPRTDSTTVGKLCCLFGKNEGVERDIRSIVFQKGSNICFPIKLPLGLNSLDYVKLYSLMNSEGSCNTEFAVHVPEIEFHVIFEKTLKEIFGEGVKNFIKKKKSNGVLRSRAPSVLRHFIPVPPHIPKFILADKEFSREYLKIAFEAEGHPFFRGSKRYIRLTRSADVTSICKNVKEPVSKRIYVNEVKRKYPNLLLALKSNPSLTLLGEHLILEWHFGIRNKIQFECIRINKTDVKLGKITARWNLWIYAKDVNKFIEEIDFITAEKRGITRLMEKQVGHRRQYSAFDVIINVCDKNNIFYKKDFVEEMQKLGYSYSGTMAFLWRYLRRGLIKKLGRCRYKVIKLPE